MEKLIAAFKFADVQTAVVLWRWLKKNDKTFEDLEKYIKIRPVVTAAVPQTQQSKDCPECKNKMFAFPVNTSPCNQVGNDYRVQWICRQCEYEEFE